MPEFSEGTAPQFELLVYERGQPRHVRLPTGGEVLIGRSSECDVRLDDASVSRRHAVLHPGMLELEELGSKNGSWLFSGDDVNWRSVAEGNAGPGVRLQRGPRYALDPNSVIKLGNVVLGLERSAPARHTEPVRAEAPTPLDDVVLEDPAMMSTYALAARAATTPLPVLILGETGVGKDVLAEHVHRSSLRHKGAFVRVNCGALSESLLESELFGHERGAFTGAASTKPGLLELGDGGTIFLDEIGELPPQTQVKLLHVLETGEVTRVGGTKPRKIDVRYVSATNRDLAQEVQLGKFRKDLYFRINGVCLKIKPLRQRVADIEALARYFLRRFCTLNNVPEPELTPEALQHMRTYAWPGNIRELKNAMERAPILCTTGVILPQHLPAEQELTAGAPVSGWSPPLEFDDEETGVHRIEASPAGDLPARIAEALRLCGGNQTRAAVLLGISRRTLVKRLGHYQLPRPRKRVL